MLCIYFITYFFEDGFGPLVAIGYGVPSFFGAIFFSFLSRYSLIIKRPSFFSVIFFLVLFLLPAIYLLLSGNDLAFFIGFSLVGFLVSFLLMKYDALQPTVVLFNGYIRFSLRLIAIIILSVNLTSLGFFLMNYHDQRRLLTISLADSFSTVIIMGVPLFLFISQLLLARALFVYSRQENNTV